MIITSCSSTTIGWRKPNVRIAQISDLARVTTRERHGERSIRWRRSGRADGGRGERGRPGSTWQVEPPHATRPLSLAGAGALVVNLARAIVLARYRDHAGSLTRAAFLSARNDALANVAIVGAGLVTALAWRSAWPDLIVGLGIAAMNAGAAGEVWRTAHDEHRAAHG